MSWDKCQNIYMNLLECNFLRGNITPSQYVREFWETERCDEFKDFSAHRKEYSDYLNKNDPKRMGRILNYSETDLDEGITAQALFHYNKWHRDKLVSSLSMRNWLYSSVSCIQNNHHNIWSRPHIRHNTNNDRSTTMDE